MNETCELKLFDLWLDGDQGTDKDDNKFGYVGTDEKYEDEDGDEVTYCGWFFTLVGSKSTIIDSLELDETESYRECIPQQLAEQKLSAYLGKYPDLEG